MATLVKRICDICGAEAQDLDVKKFTVDSKDLAMKKQTYHMYYSVVHEKENGDMDEIDMCLICFLEIVGNKDNNVFSETEELIR